MARQHLLCPSCMQYGVHFVEALDEGDVAWCQTCKRVHLIEEPQVVLKFEKKPLPRLNG